MKKIIKYAISLLLIFAISFSFAACEDNQVAKKTPTNTIVGTYKTKYDSTTFLITLNEDLSWAFQVPSADPLEKLLAMDEIDFYSEPIVFGTYKLSDSKELYLLINDDITDSGVKGFFPNSPTKGIYDESAEVITIPIGAQEEMSFIKTEAAASSSEAEENNNQAQTGGESSQTAKHQAPAISVIKNAQANRNFIYDDCNILSEKEANELSNKLANINANYDSTILLITANDFSKFKTVDNYLDQLSSAMVLANTTKQCHIIVYNAADGSYGNGGLIESYYESSPYDFRKHIEDLPFSSTTLYSSMNEALSTFCNEIKHLYDKVEPPVYSQKEIELINIVKQAFPNETSKYNYDNNMTVDDHYFWSITINEENPDYYDYIVEVYEENFSAITSMRSFGVDVSDGKYTVTDIDALVQSEMGY